MGKRNAKSVRFFEAPLEEVKDEDLQMPNVDIGKEMQRGLPANTENVEEEFKGQKLDTEKEEREMFGDLGVEGELKIPNAHTEAEKQGLTENTESIATNTSTTTQNNRAYND